MSLLSRRVYTIERIKSLLVDAENIFSNLKLTNIVTKYADGNIGWKEQVPFDRIIFTAGTSAIPDLFFNHIDNGGIIVCPVVKNHNQALIQFKKINNEIIEHVYDDVVFVPNLKGTQ